MHTHNDSASLIDEFARAQFGVVQSIAPMIEALFERFEGISRNNVGSTIATLKQAKTMPNVEPAVDEIRVQAGEGVKLMVSPQYRILFPVDFSDRSVSAVPYVKIWVDRFGAVLDTLHVIDNRELPPEDNELRSLIERRGASLKYFSDHHFGENASRSTVLYGSIADEIEYFAEHEKVDLIMLPRDHQHLASRVLHDSLAATLLERCHASVWLTEHLDEVPPVRSILCAMHFEESPSQDAQEARILQTVQELASRFQATVAFLHVLHGHDQVSNESVTDLGNFVAAEPWAVKAQELFGSSAEFLRRSGDVIETIGDTAKQLAADLIVVGRTSPGAIGLGSQIHILKIDHAAHRPVLSVW